MEKFLKIGTFVLLLVGLTVSAYAVPYYTASQVRFVDTMESADYESDFGLYSVADPTKKLQVFRFDKEPLAYKTVSSSNWAPLSKGFGFYFGIHTGGVNDKTADYTFFSDPSLNQYANKTPVDTQFQHVLTKQIKSFVNILNIRLEDQLSLGDRDFNDMRINAISCNLKQVIPGGPAPVPEPATMLLFGTGLAGLAGIARRKKITTTE